MDTVCILLTCCLSFAFTEATAENGLMNSQNTSTEMGKDTEVHLTNVPLVNSTEHLKISTTLITATVLTSAANDNETFTRNTTTTASSHSPTSESTTSVVPFTNRTTQSTVITTETQTETSVPHTEQTTKDSQTTISATVTRTATSSVASITSQSVHLTQGRRLSESEKILTITFSVMLGCFALAVFAIKLHRWSHKLQLHQPLNDTEDLIASTDDPNTLVVSGGLYDGHPIYDRVPPDREDESHFHLEFLH